MQSFSNRILVLLRSVRALVGARSGASVQGFDTLILKNAAKAILGLCAAFLTVSLAEAKGSKAGGWGSSGGGSGVACFATEEEAKEADAYIQEGKPLPKEVRQKIRRLITLEYFEWEEYKKTNAVYGIHSFQSKEFNGILKEVDQRASMVSPLFVYRLKQAGDLIRFSSWQAQQSVPKVDDAKPRFPIPLNCRQIQIAIRYSNNNNTYGEGPVVKVPEVKVDFNQDLFSLMDPLNQAILVMHERVYLLGQAVGHPNSNIVRILTMKLFSDDLYKPKSELGYQGPHCEDLRTILQMAFGDYVLFFGEELKVPARPDSQESRYNSFYQLIQMLRNHIGQCEASGRFSPLKESHKKHARQTTCKDQAMLMLVRHPQLNEEMSYVFLAHFWYDTMVRQINSEFILVPSKDPYVLERAGRTVRNICMMLQTHEPPIISDFLVPKAKAYCERVQFNQFPKGKGQN